MQFPELVWKRPFLVAATAGAILGALLGALWPLPVANASGMTDDPMVLPPRSVVLRYAEEDFTSLRDGRLWASSASGQAASATVRSWRLLGVVTRPVGVALVEVDLKSVRVPIGQPLPDGTILRSVNAVAIVFDRDNCLFERSLYSLDDVPIATPDCPATNNATPSKPVDPSP